MFCSPSSIPKDCNNVTHREETDYDKTKLFSFRRAATKVFNYSTSCVSNRTKFRRRVLFNLEDCLVA